MVDPLRVFIASTTAHEREDLAALASRNGWRLVSEPAFADLVLASPEEWLRQASRGSAPAGRNQAPVEGLTPREFEVLRLVADGLHNREIADRLGVSEHTVKFHLGAIFGKLGASTRTEAVQKGLRLGMIEI